MYKNDGVIRYIVLKEMDNLHPKFFEMHHLLKNFRRESVEDGLKLTGNGLEVIYTRGVLECSDSDVLKDLWDIIRKDYGSNLTRAEAKEMIDWSTVPEEVNSVNFGVCLLSDDVYSGWDGSINSIWYDDNSPGEVINCYYSFWINKRLDDVSELTVDQVRSMPDAVSNLIYAKAVSKDKKEYIDSLIKGVLKSK